MSRWVQILFASFLAGLLLSVLLQATAYSCQECSPLGLGAIDRASHSDTLPDSSPALILRPFTATINSIFLPMVVAPVDRRAKTAVDFGLMTTMTDVMQFDLPVARAMGPDWIRIWLAWADVQPTQEAFDWSKYDALFARLEEVGFQALVVIYNAPEWAAPEACGPISDTVALEHFLGQAISRYRSQVAAWEFINEPDGRAPLPSYGPAIGCWGTQPQAYAQQLALFHRMVKTHDLGALVFFGGLAYDNWEVFERSFFPAALDAGAGPFFDGVSLHFYPVNPAEFPDISYKIREIQDIMAQRGVTGKRIWITETSMWANEPNGDPLGNLDNQHNYILTEFSRAYCAGVDNLFWFAVRQEREDPPLHRWLIDLNHQPANAYRTFQFYDSRVKGATCEPLGSLPAGVEGYGFRRPGDATYVLWSNTTTQTVQLPAQGSVILSNRDGTITQTLPVEAGAVRFEVGATPQMLLLDGVRQ